MPVSTHLNALIATAAAAYDAHVSDPQGRASTAAIFEALKHGGALQAGARARLPAVAHLDRLGAADDMEEGALQDLMIAFRALEPHLTWYERSGDVTNANAAYFNGHANAMIAGPGGLMRRNDVWLGVSLLAPGVRYPDHTHPPEETYLVLSDGAFYQEGRGWFTPGFGGTFYNPPGIVHAMRSGATPLFAMWALRPA